jgi:hypothetical protein
MRAHERDRVGDVVRHSVRIAGRVPGQRCAAHSLTKPEYEEIRAKPTRFVLAPGHVAPEIEHVVEREGDHVVVEKQGIAGRVSTQLDPRTA